MSDATIEYLLKLCEEIRDETRVKANTATRVGSLLYRIVQYYDVGPWLKSNSDDVAEGLITFIKGLKLGDGTSGIDGDGNATLNSLKTAVALIEKITGDITFEGIATFAAGVVTELLRSPDFEEGLAGFGIHKTASGKYRLETDELLVRVKAIFNELEIRKLSYAGGNIELSAAGSTIYRVRELGKPAGGNLVTDSDFPELDTATMVGDPEHPEAAYLSTDPQSDGLAEYNELHVEVSGRGALLYCGLYYDLAATPGGTYTVSFYYRTEEIGDGGAMELSALTEEGGEEYYKFPIGDDGGTKLELAEASGDTRVSATVAMPSTCSRLKVKIWMRRNGHFVFSRPRVEAGSAATPWSAVNRWRCYFVKDDGTMRTRNWWKPGDMAKCQTMNIEGETVSTSRLLALGTRLITANGAPVGYGAGRTGSTGNRYYWRLVTAVGSETLDDGREYDWVELTDEDTVELADSEGVVVQCEGKDKVFDGMDLDGTKWHADANDAPAAGDEIVQEGSQTDPARQHLIRLSVVGENAPAIEEYVGVGRHDGLGVYNLSARRMTALAPRTGNIFRARRFEIETEDGTVTRLVRDRGEWEEGMKCLYYDRVSYGGGLWLCVAKLGTTARPAEGSGDWQRQVAPGKDGAPGEDGTDGDPGKDGAENAITAYLTPQSLVVDQKTDGSGGFDLADARMTLTVIRGVSEEITGSCQITVATGQGCTVEHEGYNVWLTGITGTPKRASVEVLVKIPADILQPAGDTVTCRADIAVNYPGTFKETIENDVKTQLAQKTFSYVDEEGKTVEVAGISTLQQSAEGIRQEVWRRQPAGSVITNGQFTDGLEKWAVAGDVTTVRMMDVPAACLMGKATMEQSADDMTCDWSKVLNDEDSKTPVQARLTMRLWTPSGCKLSVMVESVVGDVLLEWSRQYGGLDGWTDVVVEQVQGKGVVQLWNRPRYLRISVEGTECYVADVQLVPDMTAALGAKLELTAEYFRSTVTGFDGRMTKIEQTADKISLTVQQTLDNLEATGIMLADRRIVATADNFEIRNNKGETTMRVDEDGQLSIRELRVDSQTDNKAGVQVGIDADGNPYLVGINKDGDTVWRFSGNIEINYGDGVNMRILSTSKAKLWTHEYANGDMEYIVQYYICVLLTNLSNEALTYNGDALQCRVDDWRTDGGTDYITVPFSSGGVTVPAMGSAEVLFASGDITYRVTETGGVIPSNPGLEWGGTTGVSVLYNSAAVGWVVKDEADIMFVRGELRPLSLNE